MRPCTGAQATFGRLFDVSALWQTSLCSAPRELISTREASVALNVSYSAPTSLTVADSWGPARPRPNASLRPIQGE